MPLSAATLRTTSALALLAILAAAATPAGAAGVRVTAQGRVLGPDGSPMAGWPVQLIGTQRYLEFKQRTSGGAVATVARTATDANGYYSIDVPRQRRFQFWFLRFHDAAHLDTIKYLPPADVEITADVRRDRAARVETAVRHHPDWEEVERRVAAAGGESTQRGNILRTLGLPEKSSRDEVSGVEEWWYFTKGIVYTFRGGEPVGSRRFEPVTPPGSAPGRGGI
ncbi:MAG TPA: hypothetical protein VJV23_03620 [Candidatus Polarisedimenticolia bacterium]|nr:hypothetical protein [Candidatus Polarisedimenticolia bacterium]